MRKINIVLVLLTVFLTTSSGTLMGQAFRGEGDFEFFLDAGSLPMRSGKILEIFQIAVPTKEIKYNKTDGSYEAAVSVYILLARNGTTIHEKQLMINDTRQTEPTVRDLTGFLYIADTCTVDPGGYDLTIRLEDKNRKKKTLVGMLRNRHNYSLIDAVMVEIKPFDLDRVVLSEPFLLWGQKEDGQYIPNPMKIYGLKNDTLSFFVHAMLPDDSPVDRVDVFMSVINQKGEIIDSLETDYRISGGQASVLGRFDVNSYPAGTYRVNVEVVGDGIHAMTGEEFTVAWELLNWQRPRRDVLVEARIIFNDVEYEAFQRAGIGEQEKILADYWKENDPTPHTAVNESYEIFLQRIAYANAHFSDHRQGAVTDRGQAYIRFGPPDEIVSESVPFNRTNLDEVVEKMDDQYKVVIHNTWKGIGSEDVQLYDATLNQNRPYRGGGMDTGGYELWAYTIKGRPLFKRDQLMTVRSGLRLLFVDKDGVGHYVLSGTSEDFEMEGQESNVQ